MDPCASANPAFHFAAVNLDGTAGKDGLSQDWKALASGGLVYSNPAYCRGLMKRWATKIAREAAAGTEMVVLVPNSPGVGWFREDLAPLLAAFCVHAGRVRFLDPETGQETDDSASFDSVFLYYGSRVSDFIQAFASIGWIPLPYFRACGLDPAALSGSGATTGRRPANALLYSESKEINAA